MEAVGCRHGGQIFEEMQTVGVGQSEPRVSEWAAQFSVRREGYLNAASRGALEQWSGHNRKRDQWCQLLRRVLGWVAHVKALAHFGCHLVGEALYLNLVDWRRLVSQENLPNGVWVWDHFWWFYISFEHLIKRHCFSVGHREDWGELETVRRWTLLSLGMGWVGFGHMWLEAGIAFHDVTQLMARGVLFCFVLFCHFLEFERPLG